MRHVKAHAMRVRPFAVLGLAILLGPIEASGASRALAVGASVRIGVIADLTGSAGAYGTSQKNAYELAADDLKNGRLDAGTASLRFDVRDGGSDPARAAALAREFAEGGTALLLGPTLSGEARQVDPIAAAANLSVLATSNMAPGITSLGPCVFRDALTEEQILSDSVGRAVRTWRIKTAAIAYANDNRFTETEYDLFTQALKSRNVAIVDAERYGAGQPDYRPQLRNIAGKKPDLLVVAGRSEEAGRIVLEARRLGIASHLMGGAGVNSPAFVRRAGSAAEGVMAGTAYFAGNAYAGNREFVERYARRFAVAPDLFSAQAYAAAQIAAVAVKSGATTPASMCRALKRLTQVSTVLGPLNFLPSREVRAASAAIAVKDGAFAYFP